MQAPNILLVVLDTARAARVYDSDLMPNLNEFASEGARYTNAYTTGPWSLPSHASLFTGQYTSDHRTHADNPQFTPETTPLAARLNEGGATRRWRTRTTSGLARVSASTPASTGIASAGNCSRAAKASPRWAKSTPTSPANSARSARNCSRAMA